MHRLLSLPTPFLQPRPKVKEFLRLKRLIQDNEVLCAKKKKRISKTLIRRWKYFCQVFLPFEFKEMKYIYSLFLRIVKDKSMGKIYTVEVPWMALLEMFHKRNLEGIFSDGFVEICILNK